MRQPLTRTFNTSFTHFSPAALLTIGYFLLSIAWVISGDWLAEKIAGDNASTLQQLQLAKGILFVLITGGSLYYIAAKVYKDLNQSIHRTESLELKYEALNKAIKESLFDLDLERMTATINNKMRFFIPGSCTLVSNFWEVYKQRIHPDDSERLREEYDTAIASGKKTWQTEFRLLGSDNNYYTVISSIHIIHDEDSRKPIRLIGAIQDVSALRNLQSEYYEQKLRHKRALSASIIRAQERERNRWAEELHDNVCQLLSVANLYASEIISNPESIQQHGPEIRNLIRQSVDEIRMLSSSISTPVFSKITLQQSLQQLAANIKRAKDFEFSLLSNLDEGRLCNDQKLMVYRVVQEQMNNITKYAEASSVIVKLDWDTKNKVCITVRDDGKGFDPTQVKTGLGLRNIQSRLQVYKGNMQIESSPGNGCNLHVNFSL